MTWRTAGVSTATYGCPTECKLTAKSIRILRCFNFDAILIGKIARNIFTENDVGIELVFGVIYKWPWVRHVSMELKWILFFTIRCLALEAVHTTTFWMSSFQTSEKHGNFDCLDLWSLDGASRHDYVSCNWQIVVRTFSPIDFEQVLIAASSLQMRNCLMITYGQPFRKIIVLLISQTTWIEFVTAHFCYDIAQNVSACPDTCSNAIK